MVVAHCVLAIRRLREAGEPGRGLAQEVFDTFCTNMDQSLREMGVGDLAVPKRMKKIGEAFYGRTTAYDLALTEGHEALAQAMCKNILNGDNIEKARLLAAYAEAAMTALDGLDEAALVSGSARFPLPEKAGAQQ